MNIFIYYIFPSYTYIHHTYICILTYNIMYLSNIFLYRVEYASLRLSARRYITCGIHTLYYVFMHACLCMYVNIFMYVCMSCMNVAYLFFMYLRYIKYAYLQYTY